jgi:hypothetical protein
MRLSVSEVERREYREAVLSRRWSVVSTLAAAALAWALSLSQ